MNAFINSDGILQCYGFVESNAPGDTKIEVPDDFSLSPRLWKYQGGSWLPSAPPKFSTNRPRMRNFIRNSQWRYVPGRKLFATSSGAGVYVIDNELVPARWWHGPGAGASTEGSFNQAVRGQWEGNPDQFLRLQWNTAPTQGDPHYFPVFRNTILEHWINRAAILSGKIVTLSWQMRAAGATPVALVIWRSYTSHPMEIWPGPVVNLPADQVRRVDFTMALPQITVGYDVDQYSYLGVGVDLIGETGPMIDFGPCQFHEGGPQAIEENQYEEEKLMAMQPYP